jgi:uncharacterized protein YigA (DUF484 family)
MEGPDQMSPATTMDAEAVAEYLKRNPQFFEDYADLLAEIYVPHPHGGHAIPIAERQIVALREKSAQLEQKLRELIRFGSENDVIGERLHRATLSMFAAPDLVSVIDVIRDSLADDFGIAQSALRLWGAVPVEIDAVELQPASPEIREYAESLSQPYCGPLAAFESREWFDEGQSAQSFAYLPLRHSRTFGVLALASEDPERFYPSMGTLYLSRLADVASVAIARHLLPTA